MKQLKEEMPQAQAMNHKKSLYNGKMYRREMYSTDKAQEGAIFRRSKSKMCKYRSHKLRAVPDAQAKTAVRQSMRN